MSVFIDILTALVGFNNLVNVALPKDILVLSGFKVVGRINEAKAVQGRSFYGAVNAEQQSIRLNWRVIEVNTGKVAAAGTINQQQRQSLGDMINNSQSTTSSDLLAQQVTNDVLNGLSLTPVSYSQQNTAQIESSEPLSDADLTPGSSEKPVRW